MARLHHSIHWDEKKATQNFAKHGVAFRDAEIVLLDDQGDFYHIEDYDDMHSNQEDRYNTFGSYPYDRSIVLRICWTRRLLDGQQSTRIISARKADREERIEYANQKLSGLGG